MSHKEITLSFLSDYQSKPIDNIFRAEIAEAINKVIAYLEEEY